MPPAALVDSSATCREQRISMTYMTEEKAAQGFKEGFDCSQHVLAYAAKKHSLGIGEKEALKKWLRLSAAACGTAIPVVAYPGR